MTLTGPHLVILAGVVCFGALLRLHRLAEISFWFDESFCWKMTTFAWSEQWERIARDNHPPLYFLMLKAWTQCFGDDAVPMRLLSVLCGTATILGGFLLVREVEQQTPGRAGTGRTGNPAAYLAAAGLALAPFQLEWSQQVRMYALGSALTLWSCWFLLRALNSASPHSIGDWAGYVLTAAALAHTHYYGLFVLAAQFLFGVSVAARDVLRRRPDPVPLAPVLIAFTVIGMIWSPWIPEFLAHRQQVVRSFWTQPIQPRDVTWTAVQMWTGTWTEIPYHERLATGVAAITAVVCLWQLAFSRGTRLLALIPLVTFAAAILASLGPRNVLSPRYFVFAHAALVCGVAVFLQRLPTVWLRGAASILALAGLSSLCWSTLQQRDRWAARPGFESAVAYLEEVRKPGEPIFVGNPMVQINAVAYANDHAGVFVLNRQREFPYFQGTAVMRDAEFVSPEKAADWPADRIWLLETRHWTAGSIGVALPSPWVDLREESFYDWHTPRCEVVIKECVRRRSATSGLSFIESSPKESVHHAAN